MSNAASPSAKKKGGRSRIDPRFKEAFGRVRNAIKHDLHHSMKVLKKYLIDQKNLGMTPGGLDKEFQGRAGPQSTKILEFCAEYLYENATRLRASDRSADDWRKPIFGPLSRDSGVSDEAPEALGSLSVSPLGGAASERLMIAASGSERGASDSQASPPGDRAVRGRLDVSAAASDRSGAAHQRHVDLLVMVALEDERDAILHPIKGVFGRDQWSQPELRTRETYHLATLEGDHGPLRIAVGLAAGLQGSLPIGNKTTSLISALNPRYAALVGVCAGDGELARYGDLIVPDVVYDEVRGGKRTDNQFSPDGFHREGQNFDTPDQLVKFAAHWKPRFLAKNPRPDDLDGFVYELVSRLIEYTKGSGEHPSQRKSAFQVPDATINQLLDKFRAKGYLRQDAAGYPVLTKAGLAWFRSLPRKPGPPRDFECLFNRHLVTVRDVEENDDIFQRLRDAHGRYVAAVEREAIGFLEAAKGKVDGYFVAKAVQDYARFPKTDHYRMFAAKASAAFAIEVVAARKSNLRTVSTSQGQFGSRLPFPIPWMYRRNADEPSTFGPRASTWPVSWSASVGLDRSRQVTVCSGVDGAALLTDVERVEAMLVLRDTDHRFSHRTWSVASGWDGDSKTDAALIHLSSDDLLSASKDALEGLVQRHFKQHGGNPAASVILLVPPQSVLPVSRLADLLRVPTIETDLSATVDCLEMVSGGWANVDMRSSDAELFRVMRDFDEARPITVSDQNAKTKRFRDVLAWLGGDVSDREYLLSVQTKDLRIALLAGRFGRSGRKPEPNAIRRSVALVDAAAHRPDLLYAVGSLPIEMEIVDALMSSPDFVRAVAGLVTNSETSAVPLPWFHMPIDTWRHGRHLRTPSVGEGQSTWVQAVS